MSEEYKSYLMSKVFNEDYDFYNEIIDRQWQHTRQCGKEPHVKGIACKTCYPPPENNQIGLEFMNFMEIMLEKYCAEEFTAATQTIFYEILNGINLTDEVIQHKIKELFSSITYGQQFKKDFPKILIWFRKVKEYSLNFKRTKQETKDAIQDAKLLNKVYENTPENEREDIYGDNLSFRSIESYQSEKSKLHKLSEQDELPESDFSDVSDNSSNKSFSEDNFGIFPDEQTKQIRITNSIRGIESEVITESKEAWKAYLLNEEKAREKGQIKRLIYKILRAEKEWDKIEIDYFLWKIKSDAEYFAKRLTGVSEVNMTFKVKEEKERLQTFKEIATKLGFKLEENPSSNESIEIWTAYKEVSQQTFNTKEEMKQFLTKEKDIQPMNIQKWLRTLEIPKEGNQEKWLREVVEEENLQISNINPLDDKNIFEITKEDSEGYETVSENSNSCESEDYIPKGIEKTQVIRKIPGRTRDQVKKKIARLINEENIRHFKLTEWEYEVLMELIEQQTQFKVDLTTIVRFPKEKKIGFTIYEENIQEDRKS